jgi:hypothetical protein
MNNKNNIIDPTIDTSSIVSSINDVANNTSITGTLLIMNNKNNIIDSTIDTSSIVSSINDVANNTSITGTLLIMNNKNNIIDQIKLLKSNQNYRFYDVLFRSGQIWEYSIKNILNDQIYKNTILYNYLINIKDNNLNVKIPIDNNYIKIKINSIVDNIISQNKNIILPDKNELVIHIRLGDIIEIKNFIYKDYNKLIKYFIKKYNIKKVTICSAYHFGDNPINKTWQYNEKTMNKNKEYIKNVIDKIIKEYDFLGLNIYSNEDIDLDFIYMIKSYYLITSSGAFSSRLLKLCNLNCKDFK